MEKLISDFKKLIEKIKLTSLYSKDEEVKDVLDEFSEIIELDEYIDDYIIKEMKEIIGVDDKEFVQIKNSFNELFPEDKIELSEEDMSLINSLNEAEGDEGSEEGNEGNKGLGSEEGRNKPEDGDDIPSSDEEAVEEDETEDDEDKKEVSAEDKIKIDELLSNLEQIDSNLDKIDEKDLNDTNIKDIYLKELGKKYLVEEELLELGHDMNDEENTFDKIFESKKDNTFSFNYNKTLREFKGKFCSLSESKKIFVDLVKNKLTRSLNERVNILINEGQTLFELYTVEGADDEVFFKTSLAFSISFPDFVKSVGNDTYVFDKSNIVDFVEYTKTLNSYESDGSYVMEVADGGYVEIDQETGEFDIVDDIEDATLYTEEEAEEAKTLLYESYNISAKVKKIANSNIGRSEMNNPTSKSNYFVLSENYNIEGKTILKKGSPVLLNENKEFESISVEGNKTFIKKETLFESKLIPIDSSEYAILLGESLLENNKFNKFVDLFERKNKKISLKRKMIGGKLFESLVVVDVITEEEKDLVAKPLVIDFEDEDNLVDETLSTEACLQLFDGNEEVISNVLEKELSGELETVVLIGEKETDGIDYFEDNKEYIVIHDLFESVSGNLTTVSLGDPEVIPAGTILLYKEDEGLKNITSGEIVEVPKEHIAIIEKRDPSTLINGSNYTIDDCKNKIHAEFIENYDGIYEFVSTTDGEVYYLNESEVAYFVKN